MKMKHAMDKFLSSHVQHGPAGCGCAVAQNGEKLYEADTVVTAMGMKALMNEALALSSCAPEFYIAGDCKVPRSIREANWEGYQSAVDC